MGSVAALLVDERQRTTAGLLRLIAREWVLLGHRFGTRLGAGRHHAKEGALAVYISLSVFCFAHRDYSESETAPVFLMFLDCVHQLLLQHPRAFEFDASLLLALMDAAISGRFGTFL